jgi:hypothetical protein
MTAARGGHLVLQKVLLRVGTWMCCSGCKPMTAREMSTRAVVQLRAGIWLCCSGCVQMAAHGKSGQWTCAYAVKDGHLANGCPWDIRERACTRLIMAARLAVLSAALGSLERMPGGRLWLEWLW